MANLYDLMSEYDALQEAMQDDDVSEEEVDALLERLEEIEGPLRTTVDNICRLLRNVETDAGRYQDEERRLAARRKTLENKSGRVRSWLKSSLDLLDVDKVKTDLFDVAIVEQGFRVVVIDQSQLPDEFIRVKKTPDMTRINKAYKEDGEIPSGCEVIAKKAMRIR